MIPTKLEIYAAIGVLLILTMVGAYFKGRHDGAEVVQARYDAFVAQVRAEGEAAKTKALQEQAARDKITQEQEKRHAQDTADLNARYAVALARMRAVPAKGSTSSGNLPPVPETTRICADPGENNRLLTALLVYRQSVLGLLQTCEGQTKQLTEAQAWLKAQALVK
jgi:hypothetical protein